MERARARDEASPTVARALPGLAICVVAGVLARPSPMPSAGPRATRLCGQSGWRILPRRGALALDRRGPHGPDAAGAEHRRHHLRGAAGGGICLRAVRAPRADHRGRARVTRRGQWRSGGGDPAPSTRAGLVDMRTKFSINLTGNPAMGARAFVVSPRKVIVGTSLTVVAPTGEYRGTQLINLGAHRWAFKPELGVSVPKGRWDFDGYAGVLAVHRQRRLLSRRATPHAGSGRGDPGPHELHVPVRVCGWRWTPRGTTAALPGWTGPTRPAR